MVLKNLLSIAAKNFNIPNIISLFRIFLIIPFIYFFLNENYIYNAIVLLISGVSDLLDGAVARKLGQTTKLGKILDPVADKLTLLAVIICISVRFKEIFVFSVILIIKEVIMIFASAILLKQGIMLPSAKWYGKFGTIFFYSSTIIIVLSKFIFNVRSAYLLILLFSITTLIMLFASFKYLVLFCNLYKGGCSVEE
ncbi:MAG: CDP-alcohol phosphatidyltransferase family protein [Oscillospiraceae bacterium]|jgi:cardiolipin synthase|nr:CDP-alcohol phosphatidyltransferase family protein [Oscillospiraceae bacterium]